MKPRKIKNVKVPIRGMLSSERSARRKSKPSSPKDNSFHEGLNTTAEDSINDTGKRHHGASKNRASIKTN